MHHMRRYEDVLGLAAAGLAGVLVLLYVRRPERRRHDPAARAFERELDVLSGEYPMIEGDATTSESGGGRRTARDDEAPPERGRRRA